MKIHIIAKGGRNHGQVQAISENIQEAYVLMSLTDGKAFGVEEEKDSTPRKYKKHIWKKNCEFCENTFKGNRGLGIHLAKTHGLDSPSLGGNIDFRILSVHEENTATAN